MGPLKILHFASKSIEVRLYELTFSINLAVEYRFFISFNNNYYIGKLNIILFPNFFEQPKLLLQVIKIPRISTKIKKK